MVAKFWEGLPVSERKTHKFGMARFNLKKLNEMEVTEE
jgi:hypothetical protein